MDSGDVTVLRMEWEDDPTAWGRSSSPCARPARRLVKVLSDGRRLVHEEGDDEDKFRAWYRLGARGQWRSLMLPRDKCTVLDLKLAVVRLEDLVAETWDFNMTVTPLDDADPLDDTDEIRVDADYDLRRVHATDVRQSLPRMCRGEVPLP